MSEAFVWPDFKTRVPHINQALKSVLSEAEKEGHRQGFERGQEAGRAAADEELAELRVRYADAIRDLHAARLAVTEDQVRLLADTLHGLCENVIGMELATTPRSIDGILAHAVETLSVEPSRIEVCVNPEDHQWLERHDLEARIVADETVAKGNVIVQTLDRCEAYQPLQVLSKAFETLGDDLDDD